MIKDIKLKVTPEQSRKIQEICFSKGIRWRTTWRTVSYTDAPYLYITDGRFFTYGHDYRFFLTDKREEMDTNVFIITNGTMKPSKLLKQKAIKWKRF